jgi:hypothetical protein
VKEALVFKIVRKGAQGAGVRLEADTALTPADFQSVADALGSPPIRARKIGYTAARKATESEVVETRSNGRETTNTARAGDWIVTNLSPQREPLLDLDGHLNVYVIEAARFPALYEPAGSKSAQGAIYRAKGVASAIPLPGGFDIAAPWGQRQTAADGYLLCNGTEVYGSSRGAFEAAYEVMPVATCERESRA